MKRRIQKLKAFGKISKGHLEHTELGPKLIEEAERNADLLSEILVEELKEEDIVKELPKLLNAIIDSVVIFALEKYPTANKIEKKEHLDILIHYNTDKHGAIYKLLQHLITIDIISEKFSEQNPKLVSELKPCRDTLEQLIKDFEDYK